MSKIKSIDELPSPEEGGNLKLAESPEASEDMSQLEAGLQGAAQGATLGFADELAGGLATAAAATTGQPMEGKYQEYRDLIRKRLEQAEKEYPKTVLASELVGGMVGTGLVAGALRGAAKEVVKKVLASPTKFGAIAGAGYSKGENPTEVGIDAAKGATLGKIASMVGPKVGAALGGLGGYAMSDKGDAEDVALKTGLGIVGGGAIGHANVKSGTDFTVDSLAKNFKSVKNLKNVAEDTRPLYSDAATQQALNDDVTNASLEIANKIKSRDDELSQQFGNLIQKATEEGKTADILPILNQTEARLKSLKGLTDVEKKDQELLLQHISELKTGVKETVSKYIPDLEKTDLAEKRKIIEQFANKGKELEAQGKLVGPIESADDLVSMSVLDPSKLSSEEAATNAINKRVSELKAKFGNALTVDELQTLAREELKAPYPVKQVEGDLAGRPITLTKAFEPGDVEPKVMAKAIGSEAPFTPVRQVQQEVSLPPEIDPTKYTPRQIKDLELRTDVSGELGGKVKSPLEQPYSSIKGVLEDYNSALNKALYGVVPEVQPIGQAMATERSIQEKLLGIKERGEEFTPTNIAEKIAKYVRDQSKEEGLTAENAKTAGALAKKDIEAMPQGKQRLSEVEDIIKPTIEQYQTASSRKAYVPAPVVGEKKAIAATFGLPRIASAAGHQYRATKEAINNITPSAVKTIIDMGIVSDKSVAATLSKIALEQDPIKKNALVFSLSQIPNGLKALEAVRMPASSIDDLPSPTSEE